MRKQIENEVLVGLFVTLGLGLVLLSILFLGGTRSILSSKVHYETHSMNVEGLISGAKVILAGVPVGTIDSISFDREKRSIRIDFDVEKSSSDWIRNDSTAEIATHGVLGDKYLSIHPGSEKLPLLPAGSEIPMRPSKDLSQFLNRGDRLMITLNDIATNLDHIIKGFEADNRSETIFKGMAATAKNVAQATERLNKELDQIKIKQLVGSLSDIFEKINNGTGTIGALINDPSLYDELTALMGGANRNRIIRNLVRQTIKTSDQQSSSAGEQKK